MKKRIIPFLLICILTGCASSGSPNEATPDKITVENADDVSLDKTPAESANESDADNTTAENANETNLDKTYTMKHLSFKVSSTWEHNNADGADYFYPSYGGMVLVFNTNLGKVPANDADMQDNLLQAYDGFIEDESNLKTISDNFDLKNNIHTATFTVDYEEGTQYFMYYATIKDKYLYCIILTGEMDLQDKLDKLFKEITSSISLENNPQASIGINLTIDEIIKMMDERLRKNQLPTFSDAAKVESFAEMEGFGAVAYELYTLTDGVDFEFFSNIETNELLQVMYIVDRSQLSSSAYEVVGFINASLPYLFEKDTYKDLDKKLDMNSDKESYETKAAGAEREYYYYINRQSAVHLTFLANHLTTEFFIKCTLISLFSSDAFNQFVHASVCSFNCKVFSAFPANSSVQHNIFNSIAFCISSFFNCRIIINNLTFLHLTY